MKNKIKSEEEIRQETKRRVLKMLRDPNPVSGIYAMYGAHHCPQRKIVAKNRKH